MTEHGALAAGQQRRGLGTEGDRGQVPDGVHAGVHALQLAAREQSVDRVGADAGGEQLPAGDPAPLGLRDRGDPLVSRPRNGGYSTTPEQFNEVCALSPAWGG